MTQLGHTTGVLTSSPAMATSVNATHGLGPHCAGSRVGVSSRRPFRFLSTFKWELRKGWDVLLEAYLAEFTDKVCGGCCVRP